MRMPLSRWGRASTSDSPAGPAAEPFQARGEQLGTFAHGFSRWQASLVGAWWRLPAAERRWLLPALCLLLIAGLLLAGLAWHHDYRLEVVRQDLATAQAQLEQRQAERIAAAPASISGASAHANVEGFTGTEDPAQQNTPQAQWLKLLPANPPTEEVLAELPRQVLALGLRLQRVSAQPLSALADGRLSRVQLDAELQVAYAEIKLCLRELTARYPSLAIVALDLHRHDASATLEASVRFELYGWSL